MKRMPPPIKKFLEDNRKIIDAIHGRGKTDYYLTHGIEGLRGLQNLYKSIGEAKKKTM